MEVLCVIGKIRSIVKKLPEGIGTFDGLYVTLPPPPHIPPDGGLSARV
jgi:hypothetical protein